jgi:hypothetical protein
MSFPRPWWLSVVRALIGVMTLCDGDIIGGR